jgi:hypothetical protein
MSDWGADEYEGIEAEPIAVDDTTGALVDDEPPAEPELYYGSVDEFLREYLRHVYKRPINGRSRVWAARWWEYDEAVIRLEALWRSWEFLRRDPATGMSIWWRDHADHHMPVLLDPDGPFAGVTDADENITSRGEPLPYLAPQRVCSPTCVSRIARRDPGGATDGKPMNHFVSGHYWLLTVDTWVLH